MLAGLNPKLIGEFPKIRVPYLGVPVIRILLFRVLYWGALFSETLIVLQVRKFEAPLARSKTPCLRFRRFRV